MGKITGFLEYERQETHEQEAEERIQHFNEFHSPLNDEQRKLQGARCMDCGVPYCQSGRILNNMTTGCPLNNLIPEWNELIYSGNFDLAYKRLQRTNRFSDFTSRVCPAPCEASCICGATSGDPVTVKENEYAITEKAYENGITPHKVEVRTGKQVAVIGSGPAGLATAEWLNKRGHSVTVYEKSDRLGGLLMYGIPNMKIEKRIIDRRINIMKEEGVVFKTSHDVGHNVDFNSLVETYDSIIVATGAGKARELNVPNKDAKGIYLAVDYLTNVTKNILGDDNNLINAEGKKVLVIGGGDTGNDCVGTAVRQGATAVTQLEMMSKPPLQRQSNNPWPEYPRVLKVDYGQQEAKAVYGNDPRIFETTVKEFIIDDNGNVTGAVVSRLQPTKDKGMQPTGEEFVINVDLVFIAAGFVGTQDYVIEKFKLQPDVRGNIQNENFRTNVEKVFAAGDTRRGQSLVVWALREGKDVAREVDKYLMGYSNL
ncbi:MAG: glutamate synthase [Epulopiscium sp. Nuni2H_MBin003]|nr:MAG: glutamate synthase [Epulopiscium sp. Nuni2H_MBin003]